MRHALACREVERSRYIWNGIALPRLQQVLGTVEEATRADFRNVSPRSQTSKMGDALINSAWLPSGSHFVKPAELRLEDLPDGFERDEMLGRQLGMKVDEVAVLLQRFDIPAETFTLAKQIAADPDLYRRFRTWIDDKAAKPEFPSRPTPNPERRVARATHEAQAATEKTYEHRSRSVRISEPAQDPTTWLRESYTNSAGQMICQMCEKPMPFKKRDGQYYFESVESLNTLPQEHHALYLAPLCAAKYKEFVKRDPDALERLQGTLVSSHEPIISIHVGDEETSIRFVDSHLLDLQTILRDSVNGG